MTKKRRQETHICEYCGKQFKARAGAKYCSASCRNTAAKLKRELASKQEEPIKPNFKPIETKTEEIGAIPYANYIGDTISLEEARRQMWQRLAALGIIWAIDALLKGKPKRSMRKKTA